MARADPARTRAAPRDRNRVSVEAVRSGRKPERGGASLRRAEIAGLFRDRRFRRNPQPPLERPQHAGAGPGVVRGDRRPLQFARDRPRSRDHAPPRWKRSDGGRSGAGDCNPDAGVRRSATLVGTLRAPPRRHFRGPGRYRAGGGGPSRPLLRQARQSHDPAGGLRPLPRGPATASRTA